MSKFSEIEGKELVLRITGEVQASNLAEFEQEALAVIASINTNLETDNDFAEAEQNIKSCKLIATRIHNARQKALTSTADIEALIATTGRLEDKFNKTRLDLTKKVKSEKDRRKNDIISAAVKRIKEIIDSSSAKHGLTINHKAINEAVKNKRSLTKMEEAVNLVVEEEIELIADTESNYIANMQTIDVAEKEYPGLFPDKKNLSLSDKDVVDAQIESRVSTFRYKQEVKKSTPPAVYDKKPEIDLTPPPIIIPVQQVEKSTLIVEVAAEYRDTIFNAIQDIAGVYRVWVKE